MGVQVAGRCLLSPINSPTPSQTVLSLRRDRALAPPFLGAASAKLPRARSLQLLRRRGSQSDEVTLRRCFTASFDRFVTEGDDGDEEEFLRRLEELALELQQQGNDSEVSVAPFCSGSSPPVSPSQEPLAEPPWIHVGPEPIVPSIVEKNANGMELPLSLRMIKRKKRWEKGWLQEAGESARCSVMRAFSSVVFILRELQSYTLQMREELFCEDLRGILSQVHREMESSFVWLFQQIFACTPTLMVSVMLLLANFTVYSIDYVDAAAMAARHPPAQSLVETVVAEDFHPQGRLDRFSVKSISTAGRAASVGGSGAGGGGNAKPVAGAMGDGRSSDESLSSYPTILPDGSISTALGAAETEEGREGIDTAMEAKIWQGILEEAARMKASSRDQVLMDESTLQLLVSPVTVDLPADDLHEDYLRTEMMYRRELLQDPENALLLANFAQFLYVVFHDHDRAEYYFKKATGQKAADAETWSRYASFLWRARKDTAAAEEAFLEAVAADPDNTVHNANYAHFLWNTGGDDTCYPLPSGNGGW